MVMVYTVKKSGNEFDADKKTEIKLQVYATTTSRNVHSP